MVKTRAQREQGVMTPSPRTVEKVKPRKGTSQRRNDATQHTQKSTSGACGANGKSGRQDMMITNSNTPRHKSPDTNKSSVEKRQRTPAIKQADKEEGNDEDDVGCHFHLQSNEEDAVQQKLDMTKKSGSKARRRHKIQELEETEFTVPADEEKDDETIELEENEEKEKEEKEEEEEEEEGEDSENEEDTLDNDDSSSQQNPSATKGASISKEPDPESDDDDAPPDVSSFSASRQEALDSISQALQQTKRSEERAKEKRRNRDKLLKLQKNRKKISLEHSRLPEDFLSEVARIPDVQLTEPSLAPRTHQKTREDSHHTMFDTDGKMDFDEEDDYIPLSADEPQMVEGFEVHAISRKKKAPPPKSDMALDFLQQQLYGAKIKRESVIKHKARLLKRQGKPSLAFHNPKEKRRKHKHQGSIRATAASQ